MRSSKVLMSDPDKKFECREHGPRSATYVCQHLVTSERAGFQCSATPADPNDLWPDAWCGGCEAVRSAHGGWSKESEAVAGIKLLCDRCYERSRERNWLQDDDAFQRLLADATTYLQDRQADLQARFNLGQYERYDWDQESGELIFSQGGIRQVVATIQFVGSISTRSNTWLWAWANGSVVESIKDQIRKVKAYGDGHGFLKLASAHWSALEQDGWDMTAIAAFHLEAQGAYRSPDERGYTFMVMTDVRWAQ